MRKLWIIFPRLFFGKASVAIFGKFVSGKLSAPTIFKYLNNWWLSSTEFSGKGYITKMLPFITYWVIWKTINYSLFEGKSFTPEGVIAEVKSYMHLLSMAFPLQVIACRQKHGHCFKA
ncbi:hypothetical protein ACH5RR_025899 [Cinchona calisaya]|uniref:Uncharacterized protein n=1 Tax=Cinchona calisaya TaxID=153742 RepID=A0ABD2Z501_9GENT